MQTKEELFNKLIWATNDNDLKQVTELWNSHSEYQQYFLTLKKYWLPRHASECGANSILEFILEQASSEQITEILEEKDYSAFCSAASGGFTKTLQVLWQQTADVDLHRKMFRARDYYAFGSALRQDRLEVLKFLWSVAEDEQKKVILEKMLNRKLEQSWSPHKLSATSLKEIINFMADNATAELSVLVQKLPYYSQLRNKPNSNAFFTKKQEINATPEEATESCPTVQQSIPMGTKNF